MPLNSKYDNSKDMRKQIFYLLIWVTSYSSSQERV